MAFIGLTSKERKKQRDYEMNAADDFSGFFIWREGLSCDILTRTRGNIHQTQSTN